MLLILIPVALISAEKKKHNRVKPNTVIIRLVDGYNIESIGHNDITKSRQMLKPERTYKYNSHKKISDKPLSSKKISRLIATEEPLLRTYVIKFKGDMSPFEFCSELKELYPDIIEIAEPVYIDRKQIEPNDPRLNSQYLLFDQINAFDAWDIEDGDPSVVVGISDNGIHQYHEDLLPNIAVNEDEIEDDGIDNDENGYIDDYIGYNLANEDDELGWGNTYVTDNHGTQAAGIAAAKWNNNIGIAGVAGECRMFPLKIASNNSPRDLDYSYESILVAADLGIDVLNCSWGTVKPYSQIDQSIIDYALERDVVVVVSGGNIDSYSSTTSTYYPAGYKGVLAVGEVDFNDRFDNVVGRPVRILAPSQGNMSTVVNGTYQQVSGGTSFASPVVAGVAAIARSKHPDLSARQIIEFIRQCGEDVSDINYGQYHKLLPKRIDMLEVVTTDPMSVPGIALENIEFTDIDGQARDRFVEGETVYLKVYIKNFLADGNNLKATLSKAYDFNNTIEITDSVALIPKIQQDEEFILSGYKFNIINGLSDRVIFRVDFTNEDGYHDFLKLEFTPNIDVTTFSNSAISFSVGDRGNFGFNSYSENRLGVGFILNDEPNQLWEAGIMATENNEKLVSSVYGTTDDFNDFISIEPFVYPNRHRGVIDDSGILGDRIGIETTIEYIIRNGSEQYTKAALSVKNVSGETLNDIAVGYFFDFDVNDDSDNNIAGLLPEAIPDTFKEIAAIAEYIAHAEDGHQYFGAATITNEEGAIPQASSIDYSIFGDTGFKVDDQIKTLNSDGSWQISGVHDMAIIVGMKFPGALADGESKKCDICIAGGETKEELALQLMDCLLSPSSVAEAKEYHNIQIYPVPASDFVIIEGAEPGLNSYKIVDLMGRDLLRGDFHYDTNRIDVSQIKSGSYIISISNGKEIVSVPLIVVK